MLKRLAILFCLGLLILVGCQHVPKTSVVLKGQLFVKDPDVAFPKADNAIYLVPLASDQTVMAVPTIDPKTAIQAKVDNKTGKFVFSNVTPGKYLMMIITINNDQMPVSTVDGNMAVIDVTAAQLGKTIDLKNFVVP